MPKNNSGALQALALWTQLGITLAGPMVFGAVAGRWLDGKFGTDPVLTIVLLVFGVAVGVTGAYGMIKGIIQSNSAADSDEANRDASGSGTGKQ